MSRHPGSSLNSLQGMQESGVSGIEDAQGLGTFWLQHFVYKLSHAIWLEIMSQTTAY